MTRQKRLICTALVAVISTTLEAQARASPAPESLPAPQTSSAVSLEQALTARRSRRRVAPRPLPLELIGQLLWAGQGITDAAGHRTAPSAGARYPITLYALTADRGVRYLPAGHRVIEAFAGDRRQAVWDDAYARPWLAGAPLIIVVAADYARTRGKYGAKAERFVHIEAGHVAQNILLQATALGLHGVGVGAFHDRRVPATLGLPPGEVVLYLIPLGWPPE